MRTPIIAGNWKMNKTPAEAADLARALLADLTAVSGVDRVLCPPFVSLAAVAEVIKGTPIGLGAQNIYWKDSGAFTGEVSPVMLKGWCQYVILGHSERRQYFGETDATVNQKVAAALSHGLTPIICVGEVLSENQTGKTTEVVTRQTKGCYAGLTAEQALKTVIAYEPVWAIGSGLAATPEGANATIGQIRAVVAGLYSKEVAEAIRIQYGGSVAANNAAELLAQPEIDGALVGGASLKPAEFIAIVKAAARN
jgi:triosephosphate isomerase (TIM)